MKRLLSFACLALFGCPPEVPDVSTPPPPSALRVDLRAQQTPIRNQGGRTTCITFAALAGVEAAYKRSTSLALDLSEEFLNHTGKMFWLHYNWANPSLPPPMMRDQPATFRENQVSAFGGGGGAGYVRGLADHLRVVREDLMPYLPSGHDVAQYPELQHQWFEPFWDRQIVVDNFDLHPSTLKQAALEAPQFFGVKAWRPVNANSADEIEAALLRGHEVVWDFVVEGTNEPIWRTCREMAGQPCGALGGHAVLIVGFDKTSADASQHYFIIKNSWGPTGIAGAAGFTYDYLLNGYDAVEITEVLSPVAMPQYAFVGRWSLTWDGPGATLDLYHLPGMMQWVFDEQRLGIEDRRLGVLYDSHGQGWRVNGALQSDGALQLEFSTTTPALRWDTAGAEHFTLRLSSDKRSVVGSYRGKVVTGTKVLDAAAFRALGNALVSASPALTRESDTPLPPLSF